MKNIIRGLGLAVLAGTIVSCSGTKSIAKQENTKVENTKVQEVKSEKTDTTALSDQRQQEFEYLFVEALKQKMFGNSQKAIQLLSSCLNINPNSSTAMYELASIHAANNDYTSSSLLLEKAITIDSQNKWYKLLLAQIYQKMRKFSEAADLYDELLQKEPENIEYLYMKAALLANANKYEEAIKAYDAMEAKTGINEQISVAKQQIYVSEGKIEKAFEEIDKLIKNNPEESKYYGLKADLYKSQGDSIKAFEYYNKILKMDPNNGYVHFSLASFYLSQGKVDESFEETLKGFSSDEVDLQTKLQMYMMLTSNPEESKITEDKEEKLIKLLIEKNPDEYLVHTIYADFFLKKNELAEARTQLLNAIDVESSDYMVWERVLFIDNDLQQWDSLYNHSKRAIDLFPNQPQVYFLHAVACVQLENYDETISITDEGLDYVVDNEQLKGQFLMLKGEALYKQKKLDEAFDLFDKSVKLDPDNYIALNNYAYYLSVSGRDLEKAERMSGRVIEKFPDNPTYLDTHAWVLFKRGDYTLAKFYIESAISNGGDKNPTLLEHYGDILFMLKKTDEARQYWEKAKDNGGTSAILDRKIKEEKYIEE